MELTDPIRAYVEEKLLGLSKFTSHFEPVATCDVEVGKTSDHHNKGKFFKAEINMNIPGDLLRVAVVEEDLYAAIDKAKDELKRQLVERKEKLATQERRGHQQFKEEATISPEESEE